jgi:hypothetical protein
MVFMEFGFGACLLALLCIIVSSLVLSALFFDTPRFWLSLGSKGCIYLFNQIHSNTFLANSLEEPDVLLGRLERGNIPEKGMKSWYGFSWPFGRRGKGYHRTVTLEKLHRRQNSDHGVVESVAKSSPNGKTNGSGSTGSMGRMQGKKNRNSMH